LGAEDHSSLRVQQTKKMLIESFFALLSLSARGWTAVLGQNATGN